MSRWVAFILCLAVAIGQTGCWSRREINELAIVLTAGVDVFDEDNLQLMVEIARPESLAGGEGQGMAGRPVRILGSVGPTVHDAHRNLHFRSPRELFWAHVEAKIIGEDLARQGLAEVLDWHDRDEQARRTMPLLITNGPVENIFLAEPEFEATLAEEIALLMERATEEQAMAYVPMLNDFFMALSSKHRHPVAGRLELVQVKEPQRGDDGVQVQGEGQGEELPRALRLAGLAVFRGDRLVGYLDERETRGFLWIIGEVKGAIINVTAPGSPGQLVAIEISKLNSTIKPRVEAEGNVSFLVTVEVEGDLAEQQASGDVTAELLERLEQAAGAVIKKEMEDTLTKVRQDYGVDIFGFGEALYRRQPKTWRNFEGHWDNSFPEIPIEIVVEANIRRTGLVGERIPVRKK